MKSSKLSKYVVTIVTLVTVGFTQSNAACNLQMEGDEWVVRDFNGFEIGRSLSQARATEIKINAENSGRCDTGSGGGVVNPPVIPQPPDVFFPPTQPIPQPPPIVQPPIQLPVIQNSAIYQIRDTRKGTVEFYLNYYEAANAANIHNSHYGFQAVIIDGYYLLRSLQNLRNFTLLDTIRGTRETYFDLYSAVRATNGHNQNYGSQSPVIIESAIDMWGNYIRVMSAENFVRLN